MVDKILLEKVADLLSYQEIGWMIRDSFDQDEIRDIYQTYVNTDEELSNTSPEDMIEETADFITGASNNALQILARLEKSNFKLSSEVHATPAQSVKERYSHLQASGGEKGTGAFLWAVLIDPRRDVNSLINKPATGRQGERSSAKPAGESRNWEGGREGGREGGGHQSGPRYKYENQWSSQAYYQKSTPRTGGTQTRETRTGTRPPRMQEQRPAQEDPRNLREANRKMSQELLRLKAEYEKVQTEYEKQKKEKETAKIEPVAKKEGPSPYIESLAQQFLNFQEHLKQIESKILEQEALILRRLDEIGQEIKLHRHEFLDHHTQNAIRGHITKGKEARVGLFVDAQNMFYAAKNQYSGRLDYAKLMDTAMAGRRLIQASVYLVQTPEVDQSAFVAMLQHKSYEVKTKDLRTRIDGSAKGDWDMGMAIDMIGICDKLDVVVLVSGDGDFVSLVNLLKSKGPRVEVYGFPYNTSVDLKEAADEFYPIGESLLLEYANGYNIYASESNRSYSRSYNPTPRNTSYSPSELDFSEEVEAKEQRPPAVDYSIFEQEGPR